MIILVLTYHLMLYMYSNAIFVSDMHKYISRVQNASRFLASCNPLTAILKIYYLVHDDFMPWKCFLVSLAMPLNAGHSHILCGWPEYSRFVGDLRRSCDLTVMTPIIHLKQLRLTVEHGIPVDKIYSLSPLNCRLPFPPGRNLDGLNVVTDLIPLWC